jgi:hypothetical protein
MRSMTAGLLVVVMSAVMSSCAAPTVWTKPDATSAERRADLSSCRKAAGNAVDRSYGGAGRGDDSASAGGSFQATMMQHDAIRYGDKLVDDCMVSKGYAKQRR